MMLHIVILEVLISGYHFIHFASAYPTLGNFLQAKDRATNLNDIPRYTKACKGIEIDTKHLIECVAMCMTPLNTVWGLSMLTESDGECGWFAFNEAQQKCFICFQSSNLPVVTEFVSNNSSRIFMSMTCKYSIYLYTHIHCEAREIMYLVACISPSVCLSVRAILFELPSNWE